MADLEITVDKSQLVGLIKTTDQTKQAVRLMGAEFARTGNQSAYLKGINQLVAAQSKLPAAMRMTRREIMALGNTYRQQTAFTDELSRAQYQLAAATQASSRGMNRSGVMVQQAGYQIGDFLVQVQSGTNMFVAFGQQATQVAGTLTMLGGKFLWIGSALGILIPLVTALAAGYMRTRDAANEAAKELDRSSDAIERLKNESEQAAIEVEALVEGFKSVDEYLANLEIKNLNDEIRDLSTQLADLQYAQWIGPDDVALQEKFTQEQIDALEARREEIQLLINAARQRRQQAEAQELYTDNLREQNRLIEEREEAVARITRNYEQELTLQQNLLDLAQVEATFGKDSAEYAALVTEQERETYRLRLMSNGILGKNLEQIMAYYDQQVLVNDILDKPVYGPVDPRGQNPDTPPSSRGAVQDGVGGVARSLLTDVEQLQLEFEERRAAIEEFNAIEIELFGSKNEAIRRLEEEHQAAMQNIRNQERSARLGDYSSMFSSLASVAAVGGKKLVKVQATLSAAATMISAYRNAIEAQNGTLNPAAKLAIYAKFLAQGLGAVQQIRAAAGSVGAGVGGSVGGGGDVAAPAAAAAPEPQQVIIEGIDRDSLISGEQLSKLFDRLYEENDERGIVFSVAR